MNSGNVLVAGTSGGNFFFVQFSKKDGSLDPKFNHHTGRLDVDFSRTSQLNTLVQEGDKNAWYAVGTSGGNFIVAKVIKKMFDADTDGKATADLGGNDVANAVNVVFDSKGNRVYVGGTTNINPARSTSRSSATSPSPIRSSMGCDAAFRPRRIPIAARVSRSSRRRYAAFHCETATALCDNPNEVVRSHSSLQDIVRCPGCAAVVDWEIGTSCQRCGGPAQRVDGVYYFVDLRDVSPLRAPKKEPTDQASWSKRRQRDYAYLRDKIAAIEPGSLVLDLGAGPGYFRAMYADRRYVGLDFQPYAGVDVVADLTEPLPFASSAADAVVLTHTLEHIPEPERLLAESNGYP